MKKKISAILLAAVLCLSGCVGKYIPYTFDVEEYLTPGKYKGVTYTRRSDAVTDDAVQNAVYDLMKEHGYGTEANETTGIVSYGDVVTLSMKGFIDEKEVSALSADNITITVGKGDYLDDFEKGLVGQKIGEAASISVTFPADYIMVDCAGKTARYEIRISSAVHTEMPELTDKVAQDISESKTADEFFASLNEKLKKEAVVAADDAAERDVWNAVLTDCQVKGYPAKEIDLLVASCKKQFETQAKEENKSFAEYLEGLGLSQEKYDEYALANARRLCKENMAVYAIARNEGIEASKAEMKTLAEKYMAAYGYSSLSDLYKVYPEYMVKQDILIQKVKDLVLNAAVAE